MSIDYEFRCPSAKVALHSDGWCFLDIHASGDAWEDTALVTHESLETALKACGTYAKRTEAMRQITRWLDEHADGHPVYLSDDCQAVFADLPGWRVFVLNADAVIYERPMDDDARIALIRQSLAEVARLCADPDFHFAQAFAASGWIQVEWLLGKVDELETALACAENDADHDDRCWSDGADPDRD